MEKIKFLKLSTLRICILLFQKSKPNKEEKNTKKKLLRGCAVKIKKKNLIKPKIKNALNL